MRWKPRFEYSGSRAAFELKEQPRKNTDIMKNEWHASAFLCASVLFVARHSLPRVALDHDSDRDGRSPRRAMNVVWQRRI